MSDRGLLRAYPRSEWEWLSHCVERAPEQAKMDTARQTRGQAERKDHSLYRNAHLHCGGFCSVCGVVSGHRRTCGGPLGLPPRTLHIMWTILFCWEFLPLEANNISLIARRWIKVGREALALKTVQFALMWRWKLRVARFGVRNWRIALRFSCT